MATLNTTNIKHASSSSNNIVLASNGSVNIPTLTTNTSFGKILQVIQQEKVDTWSTTSDFVFSDVTGLAATITPSSSSNKVLVVIDVIASSDNYNTYLKLLRGSTEIGNNATGKQSNQTNLFSTIGTDQTDSNNHGFCHLHNRQILDSPNTTSAVTYKIQSAARNGNYNAYINRSVPDRNDTAEYDVRHTSRIILMEVAA
tara:strand:- start:237 stop:836 length:600 start_codon:yes stop_codon:yes gene_type:complete